MKKIAELIPSITGFVPPHNYDSRCSGFLNIWLLNKEYQETVFQVLNIVLLFHYIAEYVIDYQLLLVRLRKLHTKKTH